MQIINFNLRFPYNVSKDIIYLESNYNVECNNYIKKHYFEIRDLCETHGYRFIYLPQKLPMLLADKEQLKYNFPGKDNFEFSDVDKAISRIYNLYYDFIQKQTNVIFTHPIFLFTYSESCWLCSETDCDIIDFIHECAEYEFKNEVRFRITPLSKPDDCTQADWDFCSEVDQLKDEIRIRIEKLRTYGVEDVIIRELFDYNPRLSRLVVTDDYRILLPDYDIEIKLTPLNKAVYLLFLRHEEGFLFKNLVDYRDELLSIYGHITRFEDSERIERSIDLLVDPTNNSINEKCSRIREAFVSQINDEIAKSYYITGGRLLLKHIELDRSLIVWECEL
jgi:hypothetical protein